LNQARINRVRERLYRLLSLSTNVVANESDNAFVRARRPREPEPEIIYVFDHTVLEMFIALDDETRKYPAAFHLKAWRSPADSRRVSNLVSQWEALNKQTAMLTGEYLLGGGLPGQEDGQFYMTRAHYEEFGNAVDRRAREALDKMPTPDKVTARIKELRDIGEGRPTEAANVGDVYLEDDLNRLFGGRTGEDTARNEFRRTRQIGHVLADIDGIVRIKQLDRVTSPEILDRIVPLDLRFSATSDPALKREWQEWLSKADRLRAEVTGHRRVNSNLRTDADTVALVQSIARSHLALHERIVFVTGDALLLSAYAKWHKDRLLDEPAEPHVVRSIVQYAPILNMGDMPNGLADSRSIFEMFRAALDAPLSVFNLADPDPDESPSEDHKRQMSSTGRSKISPTGPRIDLALRLEGVFESYSPIQLFFQRHLTQRWYTNSDRRFSLMASDCREFERIAIGLNTQFMERRVSSILEDILKWDDKENISQSTKNYIEDLLGGVARQSLDLWFPVAIDELERFPYAVNREGFPNQ
jgi:hypothetical protein